MTVEPCYSAVMPLNRRSCVCHCSPAGAGAVPAAGVRAVVRHPGVEHEQAAAVPGQCRGHRLDAARARRCRQDVHGPAHRDSAQERCAGRAELQQDAQQCSRACYTRLVWELLG